MKISFLVENKTNTEYVRAEHGLSVYIETDEMNILFDAGASDMFADNAEKMGIDLSKADYCVVSHGHYDHTGGIPAFCRINDKAKIILHKDAFIKTYGYMKDGTLEKVTTGIRWSEEEKKAISDRIIFTDKEYWLSDNIVVSGTIDEIPGQEMTEYFYEKKDGELIPDQMNHEQFLAINTDKGVFIFSGCSHRGVVPVLAHAKKLFPDRDILGLVAGMHLYNATSERRNKVIDEVMRLDVKTVMPVHCTGIDAICDLKMKMGERCIVATAGEVYEY